MTVDGKPIIIDFGTREHPDPFEGRSCALQYDMLDGRTESKPLGEGLSIPVPKRELLLVFKLKAAWDREHRIEKGTSHDCHGPLNFPQYRPFKFPHPLLIPLRGGGSEGRHGLVRQGCDDHRQRKYQGTRHDECWVFHHTKNRFANRTISKERIDSNQHYRDSS